MVDFYHDIKLERTIRFLVFFKVELRKNDEFRLKVISVP